MFKYSVDKVVLVWYCRCMIVLKVRDIRYKRFLTQADLAERAEVSIPVIQRMENGESVQVKSIKAVAKALGVEPAELVASEEQS